MRCLLVCCLALILVNSSFLSAQEQVFSGPQVGEKIRPFPVKQVRGKDAGKESKLLESSVDKPAVLIFWHQLGRPGFALIRSVAKYCQDQKGKVQAAIVILHDDPEIPGFRGALQYVPEEQTVVVASEGSEGPGSYGLNRNVRLTVVVANKGKVTANFALVQPSVQADGPKIVAAIAKAIGAEPPDFQKLLEASAGRMQARGRAQRQGRNMEAVARGSNAKLDGLLRRMINKQATEKQVEEIAKQVQALLKENEKAQKDLGSRARRIVNSGKLSNYGTEAAQTWIKEWAKKYGGESK